MPARKVSDPDGQGRECWRWGESGKVYCGEGAKAKAERQGRAIKAKEGGKGGATLLTDRRGRSQG